MILIAHSHYNLIKQIMSLTQTIKFKALKNLPYKPKQKLHLNR